MAVGTAIVPLGVGITSAPAYDSDEKTGGRDG
jgi:hypothetical protein